nr:TonB-dependent receptor [Sphingomonas aerophila]
MALSCVGAFATAPALAEDRVTPAPLDASADDDQRADVVVSGQRAAPHREAKQVAPLVDTPRSVVVLSSQVIEQTGSNSLEDALRTVPGITFGAAEGGNPIGDRPFIRGFDTQGAIYVDGVRDLGSQTREVFATDSVQIVRGSDSTLGGRGAAGGTINIISKLPQLDTFARVSGSYGEADYKRVTADLNAKLADTVAVRIAGVWHDQDFAKRDAIYAKRWGFAPSVTIGLGTPTRLTASYYYLESHQLPDSGIPFLFTVGNAPGTGRIVTEPAIGRVTTAGGQTGYVDRSTFYGLADRDFRDATTNQAMLRVEHDFGKLTLRNTARFNRTDQSYIFLLPDDSQGNVFGTPGAAPGPNLGAAGGYVWRRGNTRYGFTESIIDQTDLFGTFRTGSVEHSIAIGTEFAWEQARRGAFMSASGSTVSPRCNAATVARFYCTSLFNPNPYDPWVNYASDTSTTPTPIVKGAANTETQQDGTTQAVYGFDSITITPALILNLGARYDRFKSVLRPPVAAGAQQIRLARTDKLFNWQAGLVFKPTAQTSLYASYATAATPPNSLLGEGQETNALPTTITDANLQILDNLRPTKTKSYEVGAKASLVGDRLQLQAAAFQTDIDNARVTSDAGTIEFVGRSRIRGVELSASGTVLPGWTVFGGYTYLEPKILDGGYTVLTAAAVGAQGTKTVAVPSVNTGKQMPQTAKHSFTATTNVELFKGFQVGGTAIYMGRQYGGYADNRSATQNAAGVVTVNPATKVLYRSIPDYWRFDLRASYAITHAVEVSVNAQNVTNKTYFNQVYGNHYASVATGRTVFGTLSLRY